MKITKKMAPSSTKFTYNLLDLNFDDLYEIRWALKESKKKHESDIVIFEDCLNITTDEKRKQGYEKAIDSTKNDLETVIKIIDIINSKI